MGWQVYEVGCLAWIVKVGKFFERGKGFLFEMTRWRGVVRNG